MDLASRSIPFLALVACFCIVSIPATADAQDQQRGAATAEDAVNQMMTAVRDNDYPSLRALIPERQLQSFDMFGEAWVQATTLRSWSIDEISLDDEGEGGAAIVTWDADIDPEPLRQAVLRMGMQRIDSMGLKGEARAAAIAEMEAESHKEAARMVQNFTGNKVRASITRIDGRYYIGNVRAYKRDGAIAEPKPPMDEPEAVIHSYFTALQKRDLDTLRRFQPGDVEPEHFDNVLSVHLRHLTIHSFAIEDPGMDDEGTVLGYVILDAEYDEESSRMARMEVIDKIVSGMEEGEERDAFVENALAALEEECAEFTQMVTCSKMFVYFDQNANNQWCLTGMSYEYVADTAAEDARATAIAYLQAMQAHNEDRLRALSSASYLEKVISDRMDLVLASMTINGFDVGDVDVERDEDGGVTGALVRIAWDVDFDTEGCTSAMLDAVREALANEDLTDAQRRAQFMMERIDVLAQIKMIAADVRWGQILVLSMVDGVYAVKSVMRDPNGEPEEPVTGGADSPEEAAKMFLAAWQAGDIEGMQTVTEPDMRPRFENGLDDVMKAISVESFELGESRDGDMEDETIVPYTWSASVNDEAAKAAMKAFLELQMADVPVPEEQKAKMIEQAIGEMKRDVSRKDHEMSIARIGDRYFIRDPFAE